MRSQNTTARGAEFTATKKGETTWMPTAARLMMAFLFLLIATAASADTRCSDQKGWTEVDQVTVPDGNPLGAIARDGRASENFGLWFEDFPNWRMMDQGNTSEYFITPEGMQYCFIVSNLDYSELFDTVKFDIYLDIKTGGDRSLLKGLTNNTTATVKDPGGLGSGDYFRGFYISNVGPAPGTSKPTPPFMVTIYSPPCGNTNQQICAIPGTSQCKYLVDGYCCKCNSNGDSYYEGIGCIGDPDGNPPCASKMW